MYRDGKRSLQHFIISTRDDDYFTQEGKYKASTEVYDKRVKARTAELVLALMPKTIEQIFRAHTIERRDIESLFKTCTDVACGSLKYDVSEW